MTALPSDLVAHPPELDVDPIYNQQSLGLLSSAVTFQQAVKRSFDQMEHKIAPQYPLTEDDFDTYVVTDCSTGLTITSTPHGRIVHWDLEHGFPHYSTLAPYPEVGNEGRSINVLELNPVSDDESEPANEDAEAPAVRLLKNEQRET